MAVYPRRCTGSWARRMKRASRDGKRQSSRRTLLLQAVADVDVENEARLVSDSPGSIPGQGTKVPTCRAPQLGKPACNQRKPRRELAETTESWQV